jgi:DUF971 family protein
MRALLAVFCLALAGCSTTQTYPTLQVQVISLRAGDLESAGLAFITPSTVTGQEQEKQAIALGFADVLKRERKDLRVITLAETLGAVNKAGFADAYRKMYDDYRDTGLFPADALRRVGQAAGARYLAQLKLQGFEQGTRDRFGILGIRMIETKYAHIRLFLQIWDSETGAIAWEGVQELRHSHDTFSEQPVMQRTVLERTARDLVARLP